MQAFISNRYLYTKFFRARDKCEPYEYVIENDGVVNGAQIAWLSMPRMQRLNAPLWLAIWGAQEFRLCALAVNRDTRHEEVAASEFGNECGLCVRCEAD